MGNDFAIAMTWLLPEPFTKFIPFLPESMFSDKNSNKPAKDAEHSLSTANCLASPQCTAPHHTPAESAGDGVLAEDGI